MRKNKVMSLHVCIVIIRGLGTYQLLQRLDIILEGRITKMVQTTEKNPIKLKKLSPERSLMRNIQNTKKFSTIIWINLALGAGSYQSEFILRSFITSGINSATNNFQLKNKVYKKLRTLQVITTPIIKRIFMISK